MHRLAAVEHSLFVEAELFDLFTMFAQSFYSAPRVRDFWEAMAKAESFHALQILSEKLKIMRQEIDDAGTPYDPDLLLRQIRTFDDLRSALVHPPEFKQALEIALKAEKKALAFHENQIFIADYGVAEELLEALADAEEAHLELLEKLLAADNPENALEEVDLSALEP